MTEWNDKECSRRLPAWIEEVLEGMPNPPEEQLRRFDHLKEPFARAFREAYGRVSAAEVVFALSGRLVEVVAGILARLSDTLGAQPGWVPASVGTRGIGTAEAPRPNVVAVAQKLSGAYLIEAATYRDLEYIRLEMNVLEKESRRPVRPLDVSVQDESGQPVTECIHVVEGQRGAEFCGPAAGLYVFDLQWPGGKDTLTIRFQGSEGQEDEHRENA